jgi:hypothetical protein
MTQEEKTPITVFAGYVESISSRKDKTWKITIGTNELTPDKAVGLLALQNAFGFIAFKEQDFQHDEETALDAIDMDLGGGGKSPSQRLRNTFYVLWKANNKGFKTFKDYYSNAMEGVIDFYKGKIGQ